MNKNNYKKSTLLYPGHTACSGCGQLLAARHVVNALGSNTIIVNATGCLEVTTTRSGESAWGLPYIHSLFENPAAVASGIFAAQKFLQNQKSKIKNQKLGVASRHGFDNPNNPNVVVLAGDGSTYDIGFGLLAGMFERMDDILYVCFDNEGYQNTGGQYSGATPYGAETTTTPIAKKSLGADENRKDMVSFALSQGLKYVATSSSAYPKDIEAKIKEALKYKGPKYIQILVPCVPGWGIDTKDTVKVARLAVETGGYPVVEYINGKLNKKMKISQAPPKMEEYLKLQGRFKHLFASSEGKNIIAKLQNICDKNNNITQTP